MCHVLIWRACFREKACCRYSRVLSTQRTFVAVGFPICAANGCVIEGTDKIPISLFFPEIITIQLQETL